MFLNGFLLFDLTVRCWLHADYLSINHTQPQHMKESVHSGFMLKVYTFKVTLYTCTDQTLMDLYHFVESWFIWRPSVFTHVQPGMKDTENLRVSMGAVRDGRWEGQYWVPSSRCISTSTLPLFIFPFFFPLLHSYSVSVWIWRQLTTLVQVDLFNLSQ